MEKVSHAQEQYETFRQFRRDNPITQDADGWITIPIATYTREQWESMTNPSDETIAAIVEINQSVTDGSLRKEFREAVKESAIGN